VHLVKVNWNIVVLNDLWMVSSDLRFAVLNVKFVLFLLPSLSFDFVDCMLFWVLALDVGVNIVKLMLANLVLAHNFLLDILWNITGSNITTANFTQDISSQIHITL
jgi:hypothetical protein